MGRVSASSADVKRHGSLFLFLLVSACATAVPVPSPAVDARPTAVVPETRPTSGEVPSARGRPSNAPRIECVPDLSTSPSLHVRGLSGLRAERLDSSGFPLQPARDVGVAVFPLTPSRGVLEELRRALGDAALFGWELEAQVAGTLLLELEDARWCTVHGLAQIALAPQSVEQLIVGVEPFADGADGALRSFYISVFRVVGDELVLLMQGRDERFRGRDEASPFRPGWNRCRGAMGDRVDGSRAPLGVWSWNGGMSDDDALFQLTHGRHSGFWPKSAVADDPLWQWPQPLWALMGCFIASGI